MAGFSKLDWQQTILRGVGKDLTHVQVRILMHLSTYSDSKDGGRIHPGKKRIADEIGCSRTTIDKAINVLVERGYLRLVQQGGNQVRRGFANVYQLAYPKWVLDESTSPPATGHGATAVHAQGEQPVDKAPQQLDTSPPANGHEAPQQLGSHPVIDPVNYPVNSGALNSPRLSDSQKNRRPYNLAEDARSDLITCIQHVARKLAPGSGYDEYDDALQELLYHITIYIGDEARDVWEHEWKVSMPQMDASSAEQKLDHFIGHLVANGYPITEMEKAS